MVAPVESLDLAVGSRGNQEVLWPTTLCAAPVELPGMASASSQVGGGATVGAQHRRTVPAP